LGVNRFMHFGLFRARMNLPCESGLVALAGTG
jgi:hypothetical protein